MADPLHDAVVVVTGASSGIGREFARQSAATAKVVVLVARRAERLEELARELRAVRPALTVDVRPADLGDMAAVDHLAAALEADRGRVDVLINNAGLGQIGLFEQTDVDQLDAMLRVNVLGLTRLTRRLLPGMVRRGRGAVLNVSSGFGLTWMPLFSAYVGTKHYVSAFSESLRAELAGTGVRVTHLCPGPVATEFEERAGNPTGQKVPGFLELQPDQAARAGLRALRWNRPLVVPGLLARVLITSGRTTPWWVLRLLYGVAGRLMRRRLTP
jgi:short-subunit dehydrogenase